VTFDVSAIALTLLGHHLLSAPAAGLTVKATALAGWEELARAVATELAEIGSARTSSSATSSPRDARTTQPRSSAFALCPEGAIGLDAAKYPIVDYEHCKGCLVCVAECPPRAIAEVREPEA
jgi:Pyruvate/2-oxoacid:ferredoxin oxidoreductase delta subunit